MCNATQLTQESALRSDVRKALLQLADGTPAELVPLSALRSLERLGLVAWSTAFYGRELTDAGRQRAEMEREPCA